MKRETVYKEKNMNIGDLVQHFLESIVLAIVAYKVLGWAGVWLVCATYIVGTAVNMALHNKKA